MLAAFAFVHSATACGHSDPAGGSCIQPGGAATLAALLAFSLFFLLLWFTLLDLVGVLNNVDVFVCVCALVGVFWCLDGAIVVAGLARVLVGVYWICGCNSSGTGMVRHSSCSAFACDFPLFDGVIEFACALSIVKLGGLWFLAGPFQKVKEFVSRGNTRSYSLQATDIGESLIKGSGEHGIVSSLPEGLGQASGRVGVPDDAKITAAAAIEGTLHSRPGRLERLGWPGPGKAKFSFF